MPENRMPRVIARSFEQLAEVRAPRAVSSRRHRVLRNVSIDGHRRRAQRVGGALEPEYASAGFSEDTEVDGRRAALDRSLTTHPIESNA